MAKTKQLPLRKNVKSGDTWDLGKIFKNDRAWEKAYETLEEGIGGYERFRGRLGESAKVLRECFDFDANFEKLAEPLGSYAFLRHSEDVANSTYQGMVSRYTYLATRAGEIASYIAPEIQAIPRKKLESFMKSPVLADYRFSLEKLVRFRPHILSQKEERLLAMQGEIAGTASKIFEQLTDADFKFGTVENEKGRKIELTQGSFRIFLESPKRSVRRAAFDRFYAVHEDHANTLAASLSSSVKQDIYYARARNHDSALEGALFGDRVPVSVYTSLIEAVRGHLGTMHHYLDVRRKALKLREVHAYDTYVGIVDSKKVRTPYDKAADLVCEAVAPLGDEYQKTLHAGLRGRWVDRYENKGKHSGAYSAGGYTGPPYILMNYKEDLLDHVFTLAHEAGHSMHTHYSARNQPFHYYQYTIFVAEVASTFNEQLLNKHLMDRARDKKEMARLINREIEEIRGTIIRQTMFAEYEKIIHEIAEAGKPLTLERLREEYGKLLRAYWGPKFVIDPQLTLEGLRIPHFYRAFYVYKYATGLSAAIALSQAVLNGGKAERDRYLNFLKSGGSKYPLDLLRDAGVDLESPGAVIAAMNRFKDLVAELETLV